MNSTSTKLYLSDLELAKRLGVSRNTIWRWSRYRDDFPKPIKIGSGVTRWRLSDLEAFEATLGGAQ